MDPQLTSAWCNLRAPRDFSRVGDGTCHARTDIRALNWSALARRPGNARIKLKLGRVALILQICSR